MEHSTRRACSECDDPVHARGLCNRHYLAARTAGSLADHRLQRTPQRTSTIICPPDHKHASDECWTHGCRCAPCVREHHAAHQRMRRRLIAYGRPTAPPRVTVAPVLEHVHMLRAVTRAGVARIAATASVSPSVLQLALYGSSSPDQRRIPLAERTIRADVARAILDLTPGQLSPPIVPSTGTVRRLQALAAIGYWPTLLFRLMDMHSHSFARLLHGKRKRVLATTHELAVRLFAEHWDQSLTGARADRARAHAKRYGWVGPLAWDDLDDPTESPTVRPVVAISDDEDLVDEVAVAAVLAGERVRLTPADRAAAVKSLHAQGLQDTEIAARLRCADETVRRIRHRLHLKANLVISVERWLAS